MNKLKYFTRASVIAGLYFVVTYFTRPISFGVIQVRIAEAFTVLPFIFSEATLGLTVGCFLANIFSPFGAIDMIFGTLFTLLAAITTMELGRMKKSKYLAPLPPVIFNAFGISLYVVALSGLAGNIGLKDISTIFINFKLIPYLLGVISIGAGEAVATFALGLPLLSAFERRLRKYAV